MAQPSLEIDQLSEKVNDAVIGSADPADMAHSLYEAISNWFSESIFPIIMTILVFVTVVFVFYGSFQYFTAYGNEAKAESAKKTITFAIIGFIIALLAFSAATFVQRIIIKKEYEEKNQGQAIEQQTAEDSLDDSNPWTSNYLNEEN
jgi:phosphotransferase system  glucose/maltose/N-acetylglucosamine-specific IIC component